jgi:hypothetical protein
MAFNIGNISAATNDGVPYLWGSGDVVTTPTAITRYTFGKIQASDGVAQDAFGSSVAVGLSRIVVGATGDDDNGTSSGSAYIFDVTGLELAKIKPSDGAASDQFGDTVSVGSGRIVVGAPGDDDNGSNSGSAYIFNLNGTQLAKIKASDGAIDDNFGVSVAVGSGQIVVGAYGDDDNGFESGSAYIFNLSGTQLAKIKPSDGTTNDFFGSSVAIGSGLIVVGAYGDDDNGSSSGSAYIFNLSGTQLAKIKPSDGASSDQFGISVSIGSGRIVVGADGDDDNGSNSGSAYIFDLNGNQLAKIKASDGAADDSFGSSVSVGCGRIVVGAYLDDDNGSGSGSAYVFDLNGTQLTKISAPDGGSTDFYGASVAVGSGRIVSSASLDDDFGTNAGAVYAYTTPMVYTPYDVIDLNSYGQ